MLIIRCPRMSCGLAVICIKTSMSEEVFVIQLQKGERLLYKTFTKHIVTITNEWDSMDKKSHYDAFHPQ